MIQQFSSSVGHSAPSDQRRLVFIRKQWTGTAGWSDAIQQFYEGAAQQFSSTAYLELSFGSVGSVRSANKILLSMANEKGGPSDLVVLVNHSICWWLIFPTLMKLKAQGATICLCMHEHEHILGMFFVLKHLKNFRPKEILRYSRTFHRIPASLSSRVLVLADAQASVLGIADAIRTSYLPVDGRMFPAAYQRCGSGANIVVLFAHDPLRFDKGHRFVAPTQSLMKEKVDFVYGRSVNLPFDKVYTKYWECDILFLPSDWESYSLVFVEALACNKLIVTSSRVGALKLLLGKYSVDELESYGIFVSDHNAHAYAICLDRAADRVGRVDSCMTRSLFDEFGFSSMRLPGKLI